MTKPEPVGTPANAAREGLQKLFPASPLPAEPSSEFRALVTGMRLARPLWKPWLILAGFCRAIYAMTWTFVAILALWIVWQAWDRRVPVTYREVRLQTPQVRAGGEIKVLYSYIRNRVCESEITYTLFDGINEARRFGPLHSDAVGAIGPEAYVRSWKVPETAAPGAGRMRMVLSWQCPGNYLQAIYPVTMVLPEIEFEITSH